VCQGVGSEAFPFDLYGFEKNVDVMSEEKMLKKIVIVTLLNSSFSLFLDPKSPQFIFCCGRFLSRFIFFCFFLFFSEVGEDKYFSVKLNFCNNNLHCSLF
jgi:hypothetical protein